jgi:hypothetical protein
MKTDGLAVAIAEVPKAMVVPLRLNANIVAVLSNLQLG